MPLLRTRKVPKDSCAYVPLCASGIDVVPGRHLVSAELTYRESQRRVETEEYLVSDIRIVCGNNSRK